ncbi:uncharacterized protein DS421_1g16190 [Arachis hypogaea]|nr:uncharacterized protein DS421_1g16190 [Arachis hypogaea]
MVVANGAAVDECDAAMLILSCCVTAEVRNTLEWQHRSCCSVDAAAWVVVEQAAVDRAALFSDFCEFRPFNDPPELLATAGAVAEPELEPGSFMPLVAISAFERASRAEVLIAGDFELSKKESVNEFGLWNCVLR